MSIRSPRLWIALASTAALLLVVLGDIERESPGPLAAVHQRELAGGNHCSQCHGGWFTSMANACLECHEEIADDVEHGTGLHGALERGKAMVCALCHSDHRGPDFAVINRQSFVLAGVPDPDKFNHELIGFGMDGQHLELDCAACHVNADVDLLPVGQRRFGGLDMDCSTCHTDPHADRYSLACAKCHGQQAFDRLGSTGHQAHLPLIGGHGELSCRSCHGKSSPYSLESLGEGRRLSPRECLDCHESPHRQDFIENVAQLDSKTTGASCAACHRAEHTGFRGTLAVTPEQHACSGFPLGVPHHKVVCADCHSRGTESFDVGYPGRQPDDCRQCHRDPHGGQFDQGAFSTQGCIACHDRRQFEPHAFTAEQHARTAFPLSGSHLEIDCADCHDASVEGRGRTFSGTPARCDRCHGDAHRGFFDRFGKVSGPLEPGDCSRCHLTTTFSEIPAAGFDHGHWTGFPMVGAHAQAECESCHPRRANPDRFGRTLGWVDDHFGAMKDGDGNCATCHADPHRGEFDSSDHAPVVEGRTGCARCHVQASFRSFPDGFAHRRWTGFPLQGAHDTIGCSACHEPLRTPERFGRTWGRAQGRECSQCHADVHAGQFRANSINDCSRCHRVAQSFSDLSFRHDSDSRFPLGEAHEKLDCSACHHPARGEAEVVRYRPLGTDCIDCHGEQEDRLRGRKRGNR